MRIELCCVTTVAVTVGLAAFSSTQAQAQGAPPGSPAAVPAAEGEKDGMRFRGGIAATAGPVLGSDFSGFLGGVDGHLGMQINHLIGVYAVPHLSFGSITAGAASGITGFFSGTVVADATLADRIFVGGGAGYGVLNNPSGPVVHLRAGGYPLMGRGEDGVRRKGLMLGVDLRVYFVEGLTVVHPMGSIGYAAF